MRLIASRHGVLLRQFSQYAVVGGVAFMADFGSLAFLTERAGLHYLVSAPIAFIIGLATNYVLCVRWVFDHRSMQNRIHEFTIFALIGLLGLVSNNLIMYVLTDFGGINYLVSKIVAAALILLLNFSLRKTILFSEHNYS